MLKVPLIGLGSYSREKEEEIMRVVNWGLPKDLQTSASLVAVSGYNYHSSVTRYAARIW